MYIYTDDDLTTINRDYLGPKGKRLPWVASYRTYGITLVVIVAWFVVFLLSGLPLNQWVGLLYVIVVFSTVTYVVRRVRRDVSLWAMFRTGWQEVTVPRAVEPRPESHPVVVTVPRYDYDAKPKPRWWERGARAARKAAQTPSPGASRPKGQAKAETAPRGRHIPSGASASKRGKKDRATKRTS